MLWALDFGLGKVFPITVSYALVIAALAFVTGGLHLDGFADTVDGIFGGRGDRERMLVIMKDSRVGAIGVVALIFLLLVKYAALVSLHAPFRGPALLIMPTLARWSQVQLSIGSEFARREGSLAQPFLEFLEWRHFAFATIVTAAAVFFLSGTPGYFAFAVAGVFTLLARVYFKHKLGGITGDMIGAVSESVEVIMLLVFLAATGLSL